MRRGAAGRTRRRVLPLFGILLFCSAVFVTEPPGYALFFFAATVLHESGHIAAFLLCGEPLPSFRSRKFGLLLTPRAGSLPYRHECLVAAGGPLANLLACAVLLPFLRLGMGWEANFTFFAINLLTAAFNLLPIDGFDGGRILRALLSLRLPLRAAETIADLLSLLTVTLFYFLALYLFCLGGGNEYPVFLSLFLLFSEWRRQRILSEDSGGFQRKTEDLCKNGKNPPIKSVSS